MARDNHIIRPKKGPLPKAEPKPLTREERLKLLVHHALNEVAGRRQDDSTSSRGAGKRRR